MWQKVKEQCKLWLAEDGGWEEGLKTGSELYCKCQREGVMGSRSRCLPSRLLHVLVPRQTESRFPHLWEELNFLSGGRKRESARLSSQVVGFWSITAEGCVCVSAGKTIPEPLGLFQSTAPVAPSQVAERSRRLFGVKVFDCVSLRTVNHMQGRRRSQSGAFVHRSMRTHSPDTGHIKVQARTTRTHTRSHIDTHI